MTRLPTLKRFDVTVWKRKSVSDAAQIPALSTIEFYLQGATVKTAVALLHPPAPEPVEVQTYDIGSIAHTDLLQVSTDPSTVIQVAWIDRVAGKLGVINLSGATINLAVADRLVNTSNRPSIYKDPLGQIAVGTSIDTPSTTGRAEGYLAEYRFDYIINVTSSDRRLYPDAEGSFVVRS